MRPSTTSPIGVLGAGSWGTALAMQLARGGRRVLLWSPMRDELDELARTRRNERYLPGCPALPEALTPEPDLARLLAAADDLLVVVPSHAFRATLERIKEHGGERKRRIAWGTKGFEEGSGKLPHVVAREVLGEEVPLAVLSGPTFAREVALGLPTAITVAATEPAFADALADALHSRTFRTYTTDDLAGVEVGGATKNVIAIATGIADGLKLGANTRAALITRGLVEITRLGLALGGRAETFMGLAGLGDLVLTCTDDQSRNRRFGLALAAGKSQDDARREIFQVVEGASAAREAWGLARRHGIDMPITEQVYRVLYEGLAPAAAVEALLERQRKPERG